MSGYEPKVGDRVRVVVECFVHTAPDDDAAGVYAMTDERGDPPAFFLPPNLVTAIERLPDPEPEWLPGDVVRFPHRYGGGCESLIRGSDGHWRDRNGIKCNLDGLWSAGRLTPLVRDGKPVTP